MSKYQPKTQVNDRNVSKFLNNVQNEVRKQDSFILLDIFKQITKKEPTMWGSSIIGFGSYHYKSKSGIEADWMKLAFSPRKTALTLYLMCGFDEYDKTGQTKDFLTRLGKHKIGKSCLYIKKLADVDLEVLKELLAFAWQNAPGD